MKRKYFPWIAFAFFAIAVGLYPLAYYLFDMHDKGLLASKTKELLENTLWHTAFYVHITFGGIALLTGWTQFSPRLRDRYLNIHRLVGKVYVASDHCQQKSEYTGLCDQIIRTGIALGSKLKGG